MPRRACRLLDLSANIGPPRRAGVAVHPGLSGACHGRRAKNCDACGRPPPFAASASLPFSSPFRIFPARISLIFWPRSPPSSPSSCCCGTGLRKPGRTGRAPPLQLLRRAKSSAPGVPYLAAGRLRAALEPEQRESCIESVTFSFGWPGLHNLVLQLPPVVEHVHAVRGPVQSGLARRVRHVLRHRGHCLGRVARRRPRFVSFAFAPTSSAMLPAFHQLRLRSGAGLSDELLRRDRHAWPGVLPARANRFRSSALCLAGWACFLTGSDTSSNALFGNLQHITAGTPRLNPALMASANSAGGVMGKMISLQSIAVASAATAMGPEDEPQTVPLHAAP